MISLNLNEIAEAVGLPELKQPFGKQIITSVGFDTRKLNEGSLFVPLIGTNNGHQFIEEAIKKGLPAERPVCPLYMLSYIDTITYAYLSYIIATENRGSCK